MSKTSVVYPRRTFERSNNSNVNVASHKIDKYNKDSTSSISSSSRSVKPVPGFKNAHHLQDQEDKSVGEQENNKLTKSRRSNNSYKDTMARGNRINNNKDLTTGKNKERAKEPFKQVGALLKSSTSLNRSKKPMEVICLSDSEEIEVDPQSIPPNADASTTASTSRESPPKTPPPMDLESYYKSKGLSLSYVRRLNKNYVRHDGLPSEAQGIVFWDSFSPPPGFTMDDLPQSDSQSYSQPVEEVISPAILNAAKYKHKPRPLIQTLKSDDDLQEMLTRLSKRKAADKEVSPQNPSKRSTPEQKEESSPPEAIQIVDSFNNTFPCYEDDLNDSALMLCSQQVEMQYNDIGQTDICSANVKVDRNINQPSKEEIYGSERELVLKMREPRDGPLSTSTPLVNPLISRVAATETPKSNKGFDRGYLVMNSNSSSSSVSLFENSNCGSSARQNSRRGLNAGIEPVKKTLFGENPVNDVESPKTCGDFMEDDDDDLFSQIDLPYENGNREMKEKKLERCAADTSSILIINQSDDSFAKCTDALKEIDKLEAMALDSVNKKSSEQSSATGFNRQPVATSNVSSSSAPGNTTPKTACQKIRGRNPYAWKSQTSKS